MLVGQPPKGGLILQYQVIKAEYLNVIATYKLQDFKPLYVIECKHCGCVLTEIGTHNISMTKDRCPDCDISLKEASLIARTPNEKLPLLLSQKWETREAEEFYQKRMNELKQVA